VRIADDDTWSDIFSKVLVEHVEPHLGAGTFDGVVRISGAGKQPWRRAKTSDPPRLRKRFEVYCLAGSNSPTGSGELTDAGRAAPPLRVRHGREGAGATGERYPLDEEFSRGSRRDGRKASGVALWFRPPGDAGPAGRCGSIRWYGRRPAGET